MGDADGAALYLGLSRGMCRQCGAPVAARYVSDGERVYLERLCPTHGAARALVAESLRWYLEALQAAVAARPPTSCLVPRTGDCPSSCGPCGMHGQRCHLPVLSITNACDLRCPICFTYNRADRLYFMSPEEFGRHVDYIIEATGGVDLLDITGGEPTLHPELFALLRRARRPEIGRVALNTNGLRLAREPELARRLADEGIYVVLSVDSLDPATCERLHGRDVSAAKRQALDHLERHDVQTTLLMVLVDELNERELPDLLELLRRRDFVRSLCIQTMTYTGQGGGSFLPRSHLPVDGVERRLEVASSGRILQSDFVPLPTAHPLCYGVAYLLVDDDGAVHSWSRLLGRGSLAAHLGDGYLLRPSEALEAELRGAIDRLWSEGEPRGREGVVVEGICPEVEGVVEGRGKWALERPGTNGRSNALEAPELLAALKSLLRELYPTGRAVTVHERQRLAQRHVKTIYVHAHMDEDTYEVGRAMRCPDQVPVEAARLIGACNYNLFYRMRDERFFEPAAPAPQAKP